MSTDPDPAARRPRRLQRAAWILFALCLLASSTPLLAPFLWPAELLCHFRQPLGMGLAALAALGFLARVPWPAAGTALLALYTLWPMLVLGLPAESRAPRNGTLRVVSANLLWSSDVEARLLPWLVEQDADVILLLELDRERLGLVERLAERGYVHQLLSPEPADYNPMTWGRALLSRHPLREPRLTEPGPILEAWIDFEGRPLRILGTHPMRPGRPDRNDVRDATLDRLAELAARQPEVLVLGDLNLTEFSPLWAELLEGGNLYDTRAGRGHMGSWKVYMPRTNWPLPLPRLALDHVLLGPSLVTVDRRLGPEIGSDHLPIVADLGWR